MPALDPIITLVAATTFQVTGDPGPDLSRLTSLEVSFPAVLAQASPDPAAGPATAAAPGRPFGEKGSWRWHVQGGWGLDIKGWTDDQEFMLGGGVSYFIVDNLSLMIELNGFYFDQTTEPGAVASHDGWGINMNLLARWHFLSGDRWTIFVDGGAGLMGSTTRVPGPDGGEPRGGTYFNFTPQAGAGFTFELEHETRLVAGVRWHHISNARISGGNPGWDSALFYAGVSFPF